jgi:hypothetical protein
MFPLALPSPVATAPPRNPLFSCSIAGSYRNSHVSYVVCSFSIRIALPFAELPIPTIGAPVPVSDVPVWLGSELELFVPPDPGKDPLPVPVEVPPKDEPPNDELEEELPKADPEDGFPNAEPELDDGLLNADGEDVYCEPEPFTVAAPPCPGETMPAALPSP